MEMLTVVSVRASIFLLIFFDVHCNALTYLYVQNGDTCLHIASYNGHLEVVKLLVQKGGKDLLLIRNNNFNTALDDAAHQGKMDVAAFLEIQ